ncbi:hypothetical protein BLNAU_999 [Blattamonas nauphoetae]|uniref:Right handed beta helix domain-containing protein n=1 Tax=Blattamonas nauphoetae TaxID=2049346 RepID=A0ABQ9YJI3_9EUKA|nr:hypothetical protein BLNAU_999 [Blattamonas nauphoetae]
MIILSCIAWLIADTQLEPLIPQPSGSLQNVSLATGTFVGSSIVISSRELQFVGKSRPQLVVIKSSSTTTSLFELNNTKSLTISMLTFTPSASSPFIRGSCQTLRFQDSIYLCPNRDEPMIELTAGNTYFTRVSITTRSQMGAPIIAVDSSDQLLFQLENCTFSTIIMSKHAPFIASIDVAHISVIGCSFSSIQYSSTAADFRPPAHGILGNMTISRSNMTNCTGPLNGGLFHAFGYPNVKISNITVTNCQNAGRNYKHLRGNDEVSITIEDSLFTSSVSTPISPYGGAVFISSAGSLTIRRTQIKNCMSQGVGGAVSANISSKGSILLERVTMETCGTTQNGGAFFFETLPKAFNVTGSTFKGCSALNGGAIAFGQKEVDPSAFYVSSNMFQACRASGKGSDIFFLEKPASVTQTSFTGCRSSSSSPRVWDQKGRQGYDWTNGI